MSRRCLLIVVVAGIFFHSTTSTAYAVRIRINPSIAERVGSADAIVTGKVESIEEKTVTAPAHFGGDTKIEYQVAVVKIEEGISGVKGLTHIKVGFQVPPPPGGPIRPGIRRFLPPKLTKDQEVCLLVGKHPTETFFVLASEFQALDMKNNANEKEVAMAKKLAKLLADSAKALQSKDSDDRYLAAAMLVFKYRPMFAPISKTEAIDADQSKLILKAIVESDWTKTYPELMNMQTLGLFYRLGITEKDGWKPPQDANKIQVEAKKWLTDHTDSYRIQRFTSDKGSGK